MTVTLTQKILIGMVAGLVLGSLFNWFLVTLDPASVMASFIDGAVINGVLDTIGQIFVRSLRVLVVPMVFVSLVLGSASLGNSARMGPMALKTIALYLGTTCVAITLALTLALVVQPGEGMERTTDAAFTARDVPPIKDTLIDIFPTNPIAAMAEANMLQLIVFSILMGIALARVGETGKPVLNLFEGLNEVVMKMVMILMQLAPIGVFALLTKIFATEGFGAIVDLWWYFITVVMALIIHAVLVYPMALKVFTGLNPLRFFRNVRPAVMFAFSTASSSATLPITMEIAKERLGINRAVASFTLPLGATINMDGTAIMQGVATVFISQVYGIDIGLQGYLMVILTATLASVGTAGVPGVGLIMLSMVLGQVGLPIEGIALIIGVDRILDMMRTAVNVTGDSMVATVVANSETAIDLDTFRADSDIR